MPLGAAGLRYFPYIAIAIVLQLTTLYFSYRQTAAAYPTGGGAYVVVTENLGHRFGVWAAVSLLLDYLLNVAVGIASGIGAVVSAIPALHDHALSLCLVVLATLTLLNLRGVRELGLAFVVPVILFVVLLAVTMGLGIIKTWQAGGHPVPVAPIPTFPPAQRSVDLWILLAAFANGSTALTGIEAVSNGVPLFRKPSVPRAQRALTAIAVILGTFLLGFAYLCPRYRIVAMSEQERGYETVLSQLVAAVAGRHVFYYATLTVIFVVLTYSAQTSFADFPRVCRLLATTASSRRPSRTAGGAWSSRTASSCCPCCRSCCWSPSKATSTASSPSSPWARSRRSSSRRRGWSSTGCGVEAAGFARSSPSTRSARS